MGVVHQGAGLDRAMGRQKADGSATRTPRGVHIRTHRSGNATLGVHFVYARLNCREPLALEATPANIRYAANLVGEIKNAIARKTFVYADYFPDSARAGHATPAGRDTIGDRLRAYFADCKRAVELGNMSASSLASYRKVINGHLLPKWNDKRLRDLTIAETREWVMQLAGTRKTINNILIPLRAVLDDAATDEEIPFSPLDKLPLDRILGKTTKRSDYAPEPFSAGEVRKILAAAGDDRTLFQAAFFTGVRTSELLGLQWSSVDLDDGRIRIERARVAHVEQERTKTLAGKRVLELMPPALRALHDQAPATREAGQHVFTLHGKPWISDKRVRLHWVAALKRAEVTYRNPYQTRHTFATMMLALGESPLRVASLLGHATTEMVTRHYGRWIGSDSATVRAEWEALIVELAPMNFPQISRGSEKAGADAAGARVKTAVSE